VVLQKILWSESKAIIIDNDSNRKLKKENRRKTRKKIINKTSYFISLRNCLENIKFQKAKEAIEDPTFPFLAFDLNRQAQDAIRGKAWSEEKTHASYPSTFEHDSEDDGGLSQWSGLLGELSNQSRDRTQEKYRISCWWRNDRLKNPSRRRFRGSTPQL
jgi:hypothetical protein